MAGNWIKMRADLHSHPKVVRIVSALNADVCPHGVQLSSEKFRVVGGLHAVWSLFDTHSEDGSLQGYTAETLDAVIGFPGLARAMASVSWLVITPQAIVLPEFDTHNGQSAKRRAQEADRKRDVRKASASDADKKRTREEKNREDIEKQKKSVPPAAADDPVALMIDAAVEYITGTGVGEKQARSLIGMLRKNRGDLDAAKALAQLQAERIADPAAWIARVAKPKPDTTGKPWDGAL